ncbi:hypothetical protein ACTPGT_002413 [Enterococcus hirae]
MIINEEKRWIGGAATADINLVFVKDTSDNKLNVLLFQEILKERLLSE